MHCILDAVKKVLNMRRKKSFRNLYVQLDNCSSNKNFTVIAGVAVLVALGICRKAKLSYLIVGHTHDDIDAIIGNVVSYLRKLDLLSFEILKKGCEEAISKEGSTVIDVNQVVGITDFDALFFDVNQQDIKGIS